MGDRVVKRLLRMRKVVGSIPGRGCTNLYYASDALGVVAWWEVIASQLDLPSLMPLSANVCCQLQLIVVYWINSVA